MWSHVYLGPGRYLIRTSGTCKHSFLILLELVLQNQCVLKMLDRIIVFEKSFKDADALRMRGASCQFKGCRIQKPVTRQIDDSKKKCSNSNKTGEHQRRWKIIMTAGGENIVNWKVLNSNFRMFGVNDETVSELPNDLKMKQQKLFSRIETKLSLVDSYSIQSLAGKIVPPLKTRRKLSCDDFIHTS